jgi:peptide/nickel transport system ATP-binding protein
MLEEMLLEVKNLKTEFKLKRGIVKAVDDVSFHINKGEILAIVGESGSGKSVTSLSIMGLLQKPGRIAGGEIFFKSQDLNKMSKRELQKIRGNQISMIFQEPMTSLNRSGD